MIVLTPLSISAILKGLAAPRTAGIASVLDTMYGDTTLAHDTLVIPQPGSGEYSWQVSTTITHCTSVADTTLGYSSSEILNFMHLYDALEHMRASLPLINEACLAS